MNLSEDACKNRVHWDAKSDSYQSAHGGQLGRAPLAWGAWSIPEDELHVLGDVRGKDVLEFGCGAAQWSVALTARGARCVGLDNSARQLEHARRNMKDANVEFPLVHASAEAVPLLAKSFDIVFCDHGAMTWADPLAAVPEAARLLRAGGLLAFSAETPLHEDYFEQRKSDDGDSVCYSLSYGEWVALFRRCGFIIEDLIELRPADDSQTTYTEFVSREWARKWPAEQIWRVRLPGKAFDTSR